MSAIIFRLPLLDGSTEEVPIAGFIRHDEYVTAFRDTPEGHSAMLAFSMVPRDLRAIMLDEVTAAIADDPLANFSPDGGLARGTLLLECPRALMVSPALRTGRGVTGRLRRGRALSRPARRRGGHRRRPLG
jgi:hypothetical protein